MGGITLVVGDGDFSFSRALVLRSRGADWRPEEEELVHNAVIANEEITEATANAA